MHNIKFHQLQGAVTLEATGPNDISFDIGEITENETIEARMGLYVGYEEGSHELTVRMTLKEAEAVLMTLQQSVDQLRVKKLARAIKAVYQDPEPENGVPTELFFENKAKTMIKKYPEKVASTLAAYDQLVKDVNEN